MGIRARMVVISNTAKENTAEIPRTEDAEEFKVAEVKTTVRGEISGGMDSRPVWILPPVRADDVLVVVVCWARGGGDSLVKAES